MAKLHLTNDVFMSELTLMFHNARTHGEVTTTIKRYDGRTRPHPKPRKLKNGKMSKVNPLPEPDEYSCLLRAKSKDKKISTVVSAADALKFQLQFSQFLRSNMDGLKKEKKAKKKVKKATQ
ncbi:signal recognition particle 14 kDa protein-like [Homarus americanus]|uniref:Signal recognition particle 14 kDa protein n=1 Tax=Homarus americanus TaxID=6706 RepID=A0A8J5T501_HOMAM|nr:signal recognition particle 14 kDa protein-like [Homarus americanus]KAG7172620.1 Signal recognition particle 14 kDa protein-like [Homarus americanus]